MDLRFCLRGLGAVLAIASFAAPAPAQVEPSLTSPSASAEKPSLTLGVGTRVRLMVLHEVTSRTAKPGQRFKLRVDEAVVIDGVSVVPVGATAWGEVIAAQGTAAAGGKGRISARLLYLELPSGNVPLTGTHGKEGNGNTAGVVLGVLAWGPFGLLNKGNDARLKAGDIMIGSVDGVTQSESPH